MKVSSTMFLILLVIRGVWSAPTASVQSSHVEIGLQAGVITQMTNRMTGETLSVRTVPALTGIRHLRAGDLWNDRARTELTASRSRVAFTMRWQSNGLVYRLSTRFLALPSGEIAVDQQAECAQPGLVGLQWGLAIPNEFELLVPGASGKRWSADSDFQPLQLDYPTSWEAQFVLIQGKQGGFLIYGDDDATRFKRLFIQHRDGQFWIGLETWCTAPFERIRRDVSVGWRIRAYRGGWLVGASLYRQWAERRFRLAELRKLQPAWVKDIQTVVIDNLDDLKRLEALAKRLNPRQTLVYVPDWRKDGYDRNYPDYTPREGWEERIRTAKQMGFRIMLHVNYFGVTPENPAYERMKRYHMRDPFSKQYYYWDWSRADPPIKFAYINPASKEWRRLFVQKMVEVCQQLHPDALHLDQTLVIPNDANGIIDGMNTMQGNIALHRELVQALPGVALSGEGLDEITFRYESFAQRHVWGINPADTSWDMTQIREAHAVSSSLLTPHTKIYGYLGMTNPRMWQYYVAWRTAYERFGVLPTFASLDTAQVSQPDEALQALWDEARWFQEHCPVPDFSPELWTEGTLFAYRTQNGQIARYVAEPTGVRLEHVTPNGVQVVYRRIMGVSRAQINGTIPKWLAYNDRELLGLNPEHGYAWLPTPRDLNALHLHDLSETLSLSEASVHAGRWARFAFRQGEQVIARLWSGRLDVAHAVADANSKSIVRHGYLMDDPETGAVARPHGDGLFLHPPWRAKAGGSVWLETTLQLPADRPCQFRSEVGFTSPDAARKSDGVTFVVTVFGETEKLTAQRHVEGTVTQEMALDLSALRGQRVRVRLEARPGADGSPEFDWGWMVRPRIVAIEDKSHPVEVFSPQPILYAFGNGEPLTVESAGANRYRFTVPGENPTLVLLQTEADTISLPVDLTALPFDTGIELDGMARPPVDFMRGVVAAGKCGGVERKGFSAHPPPNGMTYMTFLLRLPEREAHLRGFVGIADGAEGKSNGVRFAIEVNGKPVMSRVVNAGEGWIAFEASLAEWAGTTVLLRLVTDALGNFGWDWAQWGEVRIE